MPPAADAPAPPSSSVYESTRALPARAVGLQTLAVVEEASVVVVVARSQQVRARGPKHLLEFAIRALQQHLATKGCDYCQLS